MDTPEDVAGDPDNYLDLQQALTTVYDLIGYDLVVNYERAPEIVLSSEIATWAENRVREWFRKKKKGTQ